MANASTRVENLKEECKTEGSPCCVIHNAIGNLMTFVRSREWNGNPIHPYPLEIQNAANGKDNPATFSNVKDSFGSVAAVVYRGKIGNGGKDYDHMIAWSNPLPSNGKNSVLVETGRETDYFTDEELDKRRTKLYVPCSTSSDTRNGCKSSIIITDDTSAKVEAKFTLAS